MPKTLVNIITDDDPISAYLFVKEMYKEGDKLLFVSAKDTLRDMNDLVSLLDVSEDIVTEVAFDRHCDEYLYERICRKLREYLSEGVEYYVNLAGGTRYMALAVQQAFNRFHSKFFYTNVENNVIISTIYDDSIDDDDDFIYPIRYRMSVGEYLSLQGLYHDITVEDPHRPQFPRKTADCIFDVAVHRKLSSEEHEVFEKLREGYRNARSRHSRKTLPRLKRRASIEIEEIRNPTNPEWIPVPSIVDFLKRIDFQPKTTGFLSREEIDYITGGWFEEFVGYWVLNAVRPDDLAVGVHISRRIADHDNELDVVFTKANRLFVIECKSGISTTSMFNEIVYKSCALNRALLGVNCHSFLFSLKRDEDGVLKQVSDSMGVRFCDFATLTNPRKRSKLSATMKALSRSAL